MDFIEINSGREVVYNFLSRSLIDCPDKQYLQMFEKLYTYLVAIIDDSEDINIIKAKKILLNLINDINASDDKNSIVLKLSKEYTNLFCLGSYSIAPYESVYLSAENYSNKSLGKKSLAYLMKINFSQKRTLMYLRIISLMNFSL